MNRSFAKHTFLIVVILACSFSCGIKKADNSLTIDAYRALGIPDPGKKWDMADYTQARNVLAKLKWESPLQLPVKDSKKSGLMFEHMLSLDYLQFLQDSVITRNEKAQRISEFGVVYDYWIDVYTNPTIQRSYYSPEIVDIRIFNLRLAEAAFNLANEINKSNDPHDIALRYGYGSIKRAYLECLNNYLQPEVYGWAFAEQDIERMVDSIHQSIMRNKEWIDSSAVTELKYSLRSAMDSTSSTRTRDKYKRLEKLLVISNQ
jgi:hypothetical protein